LGLPGTVLTVVATHKPRRFLLDVPFAERSLASAAGARWDPRTKAWTFTGSALPTGLVRFATRAHSWERWIEDDLNHSWSPSTHTPAIALHSHQRSAAAHIGEAYRARRPGFLLADDVGLGKTYSAIAALDALPGNLNILVVSPLSVVAHWRRSIDAASSGRHRWCTINYDRLKSLLTTPESASAAKRTRTKNRRTASAGRSRVAWDVVVLDEAHLLRNPSSQRSAAVRQLVATDPDGKRSRPAFTLWLSATAGQNPLELSYLAPLLAALTGSKASELAEFETWCQEQGIGVKRGAFGAWSWVRNDADLDRMRTLLFDGSPLPGLRRRPTDLAGWPEQQRVAWPVELDASSRALYEEAWEEFCAIRARATESRRAGNKRLPAAENPLTALLRFRQKASLLRVEATVELILDLLANDRQVAVSVEFLETAEAIIAALTTRQIEARRISGAEPAGEREANRLEFQQGRVPVIVFTVTEGISLHAGESATTATSTERVTVVHDPRWSAIATAQIEGRCHRDGQNALAYHCLAAETIEAKVVATTLQRLTDMKTMIGDEITGLDLLDTLA
jgi:hypothetical protein